MQWLHNNAACGLSLLLSMLQSILSERVPLSAMLFLVRKGKKKIFEPFNNHLLYVAQVYQEEKSCLGLAGTAVSAGREEVGERNAEIKQREDTEFSLALSVCCLSSLYRFPPFCVQLWRL